MKAKQLTAKQIKKIKAFIKTLAPEHRQKLQELRTKIWWWRRGEIRRAFKNPSERTRFSFSFDKPAEEIARNYELMRRSSDGKRFTKNYLELAQWERAAAYVAWNAPLQPPYRRIFDTNKRPTLGWTDPQAIEWNLFLDNQTLKKAFIDYINQHRDIQKIASPHPLKGKKLRGVSWRTVELLDCLKLKIIKYPDGSQRHTASEGRKLAEKFFDDYQSAMDHPASDFATLCEDFQTEPESYLYR